MCAILRLYWGGAFPYLKIKPKGNFDVRGFGIKLFVFRGVNDVDAADYGGDEL